ncbi:MAG: hypothetical protein ACE5I7_01365 [Candidatus Binatia bacterium]
MANSRTLVVVLATACAVAAIPVIAAGADIPRWPSEQEARLQELESQVLGLQRKLAAAQLSGDKEAAKKLAEEFRTLQGERIQLLRATRQLP